MLEKLQHYCNYELENVKKRNYDVRGAVTRCYGAVMFLLSEFGDDEEIGKWWDDTMLPQFRALY